MASAAVSNASNVSTRPAGGTVASKITRRRLEAFTDRVEKFIPPRKGSRHVLRLIREVLFFQPRHPGTSVRAALDYVNKVLHRRAISVVNRLDHHVRRAKHERLTRRGPNTRGCAGRRRGRRSRVASAGRWDDRRQPEWQRGREVAVDADTDDGQDEQDDHPEGGTHEQREILTYRSLHSPGVPLGERAGGDVTRTLGRTALLSRT